ncbi:uncharacterized protein LOC126664845 [Mercurialis annua]|uniref:uncharacterized protein LOC126664845 n=1 Tax=Mercurialis annua TaxID=3986 RepID=UPI002160F9E7|nr:uncharacterized protein LOC126664845 [Mercurialis annua]XP_050213380.1 uncharacterized protein LOC126664845 [Mercurialis annua]
MAMDIEEFYDVNLTADFIHTRNFTRVALQFPDELLKDSVRVVNAIKSKLNSLNVGEANGGERNNQTVRLFVMADTTYGSCCVDEVGASHADADCVIHYGHTCLSPTSNLPAFFVFGKASINVSSCVQSLSNYALSNTKPILVLYGLEYAHAIPHIKEELTAAASIQSIPKCSELHVADVMCSAINPAIIQTNSDGLAKTGNAVGEAAGCRHRLGGLIWELPSGNRMEDYLIVWVGSGNSAFANAVLTFNGCEIVRYDAKENYLVTDLSQQRRILKRRYYLVEKAKDANIVGILVGTLGVAGYLDMIHQMKDLITSAGKKVYTLVMGRPNPAKLANFPECDIFIYVSCAQTALLDSKEFLAPVITPFEAMIAFNRGSQWTGAYVMEFRDLINCSVVETRDKPEEARFSFIQGRYVEDFDAQENIEKDEGLALANTTERALQLHDRNSSSLIKGTINSGAEYFATRSYQGLEMHGDNSTPEPYLIGRTGKASGYEHEKTKVDNL